MAVSDTRPARRLLASIHDVSPRFMDPVDRLADRLTTHIGAPRFAMLVVPDHWGSAPIAHDAPFKAKLRAYHESGVEMFVHGWFHRDMASHRGVASLKARYLTASEGEFLGLEQAVALERLLAGKALIEDIIGAPTAGFIAPAWLYGSGALAALAETGFPMAEDHMKVWTPDGDILARGPVITWASRSPSRIASSLFFSALARKALRWQRTIRVAVHPGDVGVPALLNSIDATMRTFLKSHAAGHYRDLLKNPV